MKIFDCPNCGSNLLFIIPTIETGEIYECEECKIKFKVEEITEGKGVL